MWTRPPFFCRRSAEARLPPWILIVLAGCTPQFPEAPPEGVTMVPHANAVRLDGPPGDNGLSPAWQQALDELLVVSRSSIVRQATVEVQGSVALSLQLALTGAIRAVMPMAEVSFRRGDQTSSLLAIIRYVEPVPNRCFGQDPWVEKGFLPSGCASALTLVRMVGNPRDLQAGKAMGLEAHARDASRYGDQTEEDAEGKTAGAQGGWR